MDRIVIGLLIIISIVVSGFVAPIAMSKQAYKPGNAEKEAFAKKYSNGNVDNIEITNENNEGGSGEETWVDKKINENIAKIDENDVENLHKVFNRLDIDLLKTLGEYGFSEEELNVFENYMIEVKEEANIELFKKYKFVFES